MVFDCFLFATDCTDDTDISSDASLSIIVWNLASETHIRVICTIRGQKLLFNKFYPTIQCFPFLATIISNGLSFALSISLNSIGANCKL